MDELAAFRHNQALAQIADRLLEGQPRGKIANETNLRPDKLEEVLHSVAFIAILRKQDAALADELEEEGKAKEEGGLALILQAQAQAAQTLINLMKYSESDNQRRGAAKDIIELAEKLKNKDTGDGSRRTSLPSKQLKMLAIAAREMDKASAG